MPVPCVPRRVSDPIRPSRVEDEAQSDLPNLHADVESMRARFGPFAAAGPFMRACEAEAVMSPKRTSPTPATVHIARRKKFSNPLNMIVTRSPVDDALGSTIAAQQVQRDRVDNLEGGDDLITGHKR